MPIYTPSLSSVDAKETRRYAGLARAASFDERAIEAACEEAALLAAPRVSWEVYDYAADAAIVCAAPPFRLEGQSIARHLAGARRVCLLAATIGEAVEEAVTRHFAEGRYAHSVLLDAAATAAVEQVCDAAEALLRPRFAREGYTTRWRFSPGYGDFPIEAQPEMLRLTGAARIGVALTESLMLAPRKSVTAVIGIVRADMPSHTDTPHGCAACAKTDCPARRTNTGA